MTRTRHGSPPTPADSTAGAADYEMMFGTAMASPLVLWAILLFRVAA